MVFAIGAMHNPCVVAPSSTMLDELIKKNADMIDKLLNKQIFHDLRKFEMKKRMSALKSSIGQENGELKSLVATLLERKEAFFHLEYKYAVLAQNCDMLLV